MSSGFQPSDFINTNIYSTSSSDGYVAASRSGGLDGYVLIKASACSLIGAIAENTSASTRWYQIIDKAAAPAGTDKILVSVKALAGAQVSLDLSAFHKMTLANGLVVAVSSTGLTYTAVTGDSIITVFWI